jgi:hypothetical protein
MSSIEEKLQSYKVEVEELSKNIETDIVFDDKKLEASLVNQIDLQFKWNRMYAKVYSLRKNASIESEAAFARAYTNAVSDAYKSVSSTDAKHYAMCDDDYISSKQLETKITRLKKEVEGIVDVLESRKYILKDLTASIINECNGYIL